jgi:hypothetical protein
VKKLGLKGRSNFCVLHAIQHEVMHRRTPICFNVGRNRGPGSAAHHCMLRCARDTKPVSARLPSRAHCSRHSRLPPRGCR